MGHWKRWGAVLCALVLGLAWFAELRLSRYLHAPLAADFPRVVVPKGAGLRDVARLLRETGVAPWELGNLAAFRLRGSARSVKAGLYAFHKGDTLARVFADLGAGRVALVTVTFPEGTGAREMAALLAEHGVTRAAEFISLCFDPASPGRWGLPGDSLEGFLFPDTYRFPLEVPPKGVIDVLVRRFRQVAAAGEKEAGERGFDLLRWVTLASIVEKETGLAAERPLIAGVFCNRLGLGMRLQSDPTVIYGLARFDGNLRKDDLLRDSPYNTYARSGLPKGPITNPGRASLEAALRPAAVPYLYFVSRNDGSHVFSSTYAEHRQWVARFQRGRR